MTKNSYRVKYEKPRGRERILHPSNEKRARLVAEALLARGAKNIRVYKGSVLQYALAFRNPRDPTRL